MKREVSIYLDAMRFLAAFLVFLDHFSLNRISGGLGWQLRPFGDEAVTVFFVLSGFVIAYATAGREQSPADYCISRMARIYSVVIPALALTVLLDETGSILRPEIYTAANTFVRDLSFTRFATALTFTNELWGLSIRQGTNVAYWSLGYEVPYYVIFGLALFAPPRWRVLAVCAALLVVGPSVALAYPIWFAGVLAYRYCARSTLSPRAGMGLFIAAWIAWLLYEMIVWRFGRPLLPAPWWSKRREILQDCLIVAFFSIGLIGFNAAAHQLGGILRRFEVPIRWLAGATFTLYICHISVAQFLVACMPWPNSDVRSRAIVFAGTLAIVFLVAAVTERKKHVWHRLFTACSRHVSRLVGPARA